MQPFKIGWGQDPFKEKNFFRPPLVAPRAYKMIKIPPGVPFINLVDRTNPKLEFHKGQNIPQYPKGISLHKPQIPLKPLGPPKKRGVSRVKKAPQLLPLNQILPL